MRQFGLIGYPLSHSFSQGYFTEKFLHENEKGLQYTNFPIASINDFDDLWVKQANLQGLNITIPYKKLVIPFLHHASSVVKKINACNCIRKYNNELYGYNTDVIGFEKSLLPLLQQHHTKALVLGNGGAADAVKYCLKNLGITFLVVGRRMTDEIDVLYENLTKKILLQHLVIINTTPVGTFPHIDECPNLPYQHLTHKHLLYDLIYNPTKTMFLQKGEEQGATIKNGYQMLLLQAEENWRIWNEE